MGTGKTGDDDGLVFPPGLPAETRSVLSGGSRTDMCWAGLQRKGINESKGCPGPDSGRLRSSFLIMRLNKIRNWRRVLRLFRIKTQELTVGSNSL